jgi:hypothetical protein
MNSEIQYCTVEAPSKHYIVTKNVICLWVYKLENPSPTVGLSCSKKKAVS